MTKKLLVFLITFFSRFIFSSDLHDIVNIEYCNDNDVILESIKAYLERGVDINELDRNGNTILHIHVNRLCHNLDLNLNILQFLLDYGADIRIKNKKMQTVFEIISNHLSDLNIEQKKKKRILGIKFKKRRSEKDLFNEISKYNYRQFEILNVLLSNNNWRKVNTNFAILKMEGFEYYHKNGFRNIILFLINRHIFFKSGRSLLKLPIDNILKKCHSQCIRISGKDSLFCESLKDYCIELKKGL